MAWLEEHSRDDLYLTFTIGGELACGISLSARDNWEAFMAPFPVLPSTPDVCWEYGEPIVT